MKGIYRFGVLLLAVAVFSVMGTAFALEVPEKNNDSQLEMQQMQDKWEALTDRQRKAVYKLFAQKGKAEVALMEEYATLGLISEEEAEVFSERVEDWLEALEDSGKLPPIFGRARRNEDCRNCKPD